jgi:hypothetical protein
MVEFIRLSTHKYYDFMQLHIKLVSLPDEKKSRI